MRRLLLGATITAFAFAAPVASAHSVGARLTIPPPPLPLSHMFHYHRARAQRPKVWMTLYCQGRPHSGGIVTTGAWAGWWDGPGGICTTDEVIDWSRRHAR